MLKLIWIGDEYYLKSGTMMSSLYEEETGKRKDWGKVNIALRNGERVMIRPATEQEKEQADEMLKRYLEKEKKNENEFISGNE